MIEEKNEGKTLTLKGLRTVIIFYFIMFSTTAIALLIQLFFDYFDISVVILVSAIVTLLSLLGIFIGIVNIHKGNKEFGSKHEISTLKAKKLVTWGIIIILIAGFFILPILSPFLSVYAFARTIAMIPFWLALVYLIKELANERIKNLLWGAFFTRSILYFTSGLISRPNIYSIPVEFFVLINLIAILPSFIFIYCYYVTYNRIKNNEFVSG